MFLTANTCMVNKSKDAKLNAVVCDAFKYFKCIDGCWDRYRA